MWQGFGSGGLHEWPCYQERAVGVHTLEGTGSICLQSGLAAGHSRVSQ